MFEWKDFEDKKLNFDKNRGRVIRRMAKKALVALDIIYNQSHLEDRNNNLHMLETTLSLQGVGHNQICDIVDYCLLNDKAFIKISPRVWSFSLMDTVMALFGTNKPADRPMMLAELFVKEVSGKWNWWFLEKKDAILLVDREGIEELFGVLNSSLKGIKQKHKLSEPEYAEYAVTMMHGLISRLEEIHLNTVKVETI